MRKKIRKIRPTNYWRIGEHESWFTDMAAEGYYLEKMGTHFAHFKKGKPANMAYRIEVTQTKTIADEQLDLYENNGWDYVTSYQYFHVFSSPYERQATEIHTDPAEQAFTLQSIIKKLKFNVYGVSICTILLIGMLVALWFLDGTPVYSMVKGFVIQQTLLTLVILYSAHTVISGLVSMRMLQTRLHEGKAIDHRAPWQKSFKRNNIVTILFLAIALGNALLPAMSLLKSDTHTLPVEDVALPFVRLGDVEQNEQLQRDSDVLHDGVDWANRYSTNWSLFAPVQYEVDESGVVADMNWADDSGTYSPSISSEIYKVTAQALVPSLVSDLVKWHTYDIESNPTTVQNHATLDHLITREQDEKKEVYASKDDVVMYVRYYGNAPIENVIEQVVQKIGLVK